MQDLVQAQDLLPFSFLQAADRDTRPAGDDHGDLVAGDRLAQQPRAALLGREPLFLGLDPPLQLREPAETQFRRLGQVVVALGLLGVAPHLLHLPAERLHPAQRLALGFPLGSQRVGLRSQVREFLAQVRQARLARLVVLLGEPGRWSGFTRAWAAAAPAAPASGLLGTDWTRIPTSAKVVALTFDAGANAAGLPSIESTLRAKGVRATFFLTGS